MNDTFWFSEFKSHVVNQVQISFYHNDSTKTNTTKSSSSNVGDSSSLRNMNVEGLTYLIDINRDESGKCDYLMKQIYSLKSYRVNKNNIIIITNSNITTITTTIIIIFVDTITF